MFNKMNMNRNFHFFIICFILIFVIVMSDQALLCNGNSESCGFATEDSSMQGSSPNIDFINEDSMIWPTTTSVTNIDIDIDTTNNNHNNQHSNHNSHIEHHSWPSANPVHTHGDMENFICVTNSIMEYTWYVCLYMYICDTMYMYMNICVCLYQYRVCILTISPQNTLTIQPIY